MAISERDVRHIATLARLGMSDDRVPVMQRELNGILAHMEVLSKVDTSTVCGSEGVSSGGTWLRTDEGTPIPLALPKESFAPEMRDGFFLVPRLATHEGAGE